MNNDKLKRLAIKISDEFDYRDQQDLWDALSKYRNNHRLYFSNFSAENTIKLYIYLLCYLTEGNFDKSKEIMEKLFFASILVKEDETYSDDCGRCGGDGYYECNNCDGSGNEGCDECNGNGQVTCDVCDGDKYEEDEEGNREKCEGCNGEGEINCDECDGDGRVDCSECDGSGRFECDECYGSGREEDEDRFLYNVSLVCSWNQYFFERCELTSEKIEPTMNVDDFEELPNVVILTDYEGDYAEFQDGVEWGEVYCVAYTTTPSLILDRSLKVKFSQNPSLYDYID